MFCSKCGQPCEEGMSFCKHCGAPLSQNIPADGIRYADASRQPVPAQMISQNPVIDLMRRLTTSPLFLIGAIAYSCTILFTLIAAMSTSSLEWLMDQYFNFLFQYGSIGEIGEIMGQVNRILPMMRRMSFGSALFGQIPAILIAVGIWLLFASAKNRSAAPLKATGLSLIKAVAIFYIVVNSLLALLVMVALFIVMAVAAGYEESLAAIFLVVIVLAAVVFFLAILFYVKLAGTIQTMQTTLRTGVPSDRVSVYVAVLSIFGGFGSLVGLLGAGGLSSVLANVAAATASFCYGSFLFHYRSEMGAMVLAQQCVPQTRGNNPQPAPQTAAENVSEPMVQKTSNTPITPPRPLVPETTVLNAPTKQPNLQIIYVRDGSCVPITQSRFRIGRDPATVDYIVNDNTAVGRQHADIMLHDGGCYVVDLNSTNHTYLNGEQLAPGTEYPLHDGDELLLGDEAFRINLS